MVQQVVCVPVCMWALQQAVSYPECVLTWHLVFLGYSGRVIKDKWMMNALLASCSFSCSIPHTSRLYSCSIVEIGIRPFMWHLKGHSFIHSFIHILCMLFPGQGCGLSGAYPGNTRQKAGTHSGWDANQSKATMHTNVYILIHTLGLLSIASSPASIFFMKWRGRRKPT